MKKLTSYQFWIGIASGGLLIVQWLSKYFGVNINPDLYLEVVSGVLSIFVVLGFLVPTKQQGETTMEHIVFTDKEKAKAFTKALQQANITYTVTQLSNGILFAIESQATDITSVEQTAQQVAQDIVENAQTLLETQTQNETNVQAQPLHVSSEAEQNASNQLETFSLENVETTNGNQASVLTPSAPPCALEQTTGVQSGQESTQAVFEIEPAQASVSVHAPIEQTLATQQTEQAPPLEKEDACNQTVLIDAEKTSTSVQSAQNTVQASAEAETINMQKQKEIAEEILMLQNANTADEQQIAILKESRELYATTCIQELQVCIENRNQRIAFLQATLASL